MNLKGKRFLVIGGAGLIGSHTIDALLKEDIKEIIIYDNFTRGVHENVATALKDSRAKIYDVGGDICQADILHSATKGIDGVFHFAALWLLQCYDYPRSAFQTNIEGTFNVLEACVHGGVKRLIYSSSASVYGNAVEEPMRENHPFKNTTFYGATKIAGEAMATAYYHRFGLPVVGLRYMNVYGPRQDYKGVYIAVIMKMLDAIERGETIKIYGDGSQAYDFIYVEDCAKANVCAMKANTVDEYYNVGTGKRTTILELAKIIQKLTNTQDNIEYLPQGKTFVKNRIGCPEKATEQIQFKASVELENGLKKLIEWRQLRISECVV